MSVQTNSVSTAEIETILNIICAEQGIFDYKIFKSDGSQKGDGYVGIIKSIRIIGQDKNKKEKVLNLIAKCAATSDAVRNQFPVERVFHREIYVYNTLLPMFKAFEVEREVSPSYFAPMFYKACLTDKNELLIMDNLKDNNYRLCERGTTMDNNHVSLVLKEYGRFHALSFALCDQKPKLFEDLKEHMDDLYTKFMIESNFQQALISQCKKAQQALDADTDEKAIQVYEKFTNTIESFFEQLLHSDEDYAVVLHGDCWTNNMMFKYEDEEDSRKPTAVRFIDFQVSRLGSPVLDIAYFFYACSARDVIEKFDYYMKLYYSSLSEHLKNLGTDADKVFPYAVLEQQWKRYAKFGLVVAPMAMHAMLSEVNESVDVTELVESGTDVVNMFDYKIASEEKYNRRIRDVILHFVNNQLI